MEFDIIHLKEIDSTNKYAYRLGKEGKKNIIVVSDVQTHGVGRLERKWYSNLGGLYFSILIGLDDFKRTCENENIGKLNFLGSISSYESLNYYLKDFCYLKDFSKADIGIKFPNDIVVEIGNRTKKISGILSEVSMNYGFLILGVGMNINNRMNNMDNMDKHNNNSKNNKNNNEEDIKNIAISLKELIGKEIDRFKILDRFIDNFKYNYYLDDIEILKKYKEYSKTLGKYVKIITPEEEIKGTVFNIDYEGIYLATDDGKLKHVYVGDCVHLRTCSTSYIYKL